MFLNIDDIVTATKTTAMSDGGEQKAAGMNRTWWTGLLKTSRGQKKRLLGNLPRTARL